MAVTSSAKLLFVLLAGLAAGSAAPPPPSGAPADTAREVATAAPIVMAQFNPCPNRKCRR